jgi:predicted metal-dependent phosphoesterase TrpH
VAVLAHPFLNLDEAELRAFLPEAVEAGLDGMETAYAKYSPETTALAEAIAAEFGLKNSGGSDFHGGNKPDIAIGTGRGNLAIPVEWLDNLHECLK